ncbi:MAG: acyl-ACP--UDP-N-acetylglucosamine O-acyltransferase [Thiobacillus sp.]|nr:acyl-ACP--UDP-N-acetylglucosamine O-acyltransferase [Thiobacillus sp.]
MAKIHPTALVDAKAQLADDVEIGPYSIIGEHVKIGAGTTVGSHAVITGHTTIGAHNQIFHFVSLGEAPQDKKYAGEPTRLEIGDHNVIREFCTFNIGTIQDRGVTTIGSHNWIMAYVHIAHDCIVGDRTIFANNASLAGHAEIGDWVILGGFTGVHQFCKIGAHVMTGISSVVFKDIPPFVMASGQPAAPHGLNNEGLKRRGFTAESLTALKRAYKTLYREGNTLAEAQTQLAISAATNAEVQQLLDFLEHSERGIIR